LALVIGGAVDPTDSRNTENQIAIGVVVLGAMVRRA
jgi:hypothetical protein